MLIKKQVQNGDTCLADSNNFLTMAVMALFAIGFAASDEEESVNSENSEPKTEQKQESEAERKAREQKEEAERKANEQKAKQDKILKEGYDRGYNDAMQYTYYQEMYYRIPYTKLYGAPKSDEEIALYKQYKEQYDKGWEEGKKVKAKMDE